MMIMVNDTMIIVVVVVVVVVSMFDALTDRNIVAKVNNFVLV